MLRSVPRALEPLPTIQTAHGPIAITIEAENGVFRVKTTYPDGIKGDLSPELPDRATAYRLAYGSLYRLSAAVRSNLAGPVSSRPARPPRALKESSRPRARSRPGTTFLYEFFYTGKLHGSQKAPRPQEAEPGKAHPARNLAPEWWKADRDPHLRIEHRINEGPEPGKAQPPPRDPSPEVIGYGSPSPHDPP